MVRVLSRLKRTAAMGSVGCRPATVREPPISHYNSGMNETLPKDVQDFVHQAVANGEYASADDVMIAALRTIRELRQRRESLRQDIAVGVGELDRDEGEVWDVDAIKAELDLRLDSNPERG